MCIAIPAQVVELRGPNAVVQRYGERLEVSLLLLPEDVVVGDFLIVQARAYAVAKVTTEEADQIYRLFEEFAGGVCDNEAA